MANLDTKPKTFQPLHLQRLGDRIRKMRIDCGLSLDRVATRLRVSKGYLSRLERGKAKPSRRLLEKISQAVTADPEPLCVLAGYVPEDVKKILCLHPEEAPAMLRETFVPYGKADAPGESGGQIHGYPLATSEPIGLKTNLRHLYELVHGDCFEWLERRTPNSIHAIVTDPPYGLKEFSDREKGKLRRGRGGVWRIPPCLDGCARNPLPRFTVLTDRDKQSLRDFFFRWGTLAFRVLVPGGHVFIATNPLVSHFVYMALNEAGFEKRGEIIRLVQTLRGGDRPKNAHREFRDVTVMPRSCWEPWGLFRKPCEGRVQDNLRKWRTGGLRRLSQERPFCDMIRSAPTRSLERDIAPHPSLKPQAFMRQVVRGALPLEEGIILDPFMGAGSTIAAACAVGYMSIGIESDAEFYEMALKAIPRLAAILPNNNHRVPAFSPLREVQGMLF